MSHSARVSQDWVGDPFESVVLVPGGGLCNFLGFGHFNIFTFDEKKKKRPLFSIYIYIYLLYQIQ